MSILAQVTRFVAVCPIVLLSVACFVSGTCLGPQGW